MNTRWIALALLVAIPCAEAYQKRKKGRADRIAPPPVTYDAAAINSAEQADIKQGDKGSGVVRAQILLARAHFSSGEIDGSFGTNLRRAVGAFQENRQLPVSGNVDAATWNALNADAAPVLIA